MIVFILLDITDLFSNGFYNSNNSSVLFCFLTDLGRIKGNKLRFSHISQVYNPKNFYKVNIAV